MNDKDVANVGKKKSRHRKLHPHGKMKVTINVNEENPEPMEVIAKSIIDVADAFERITKSPLKQITIILLIQGITGQSQREITKVLDACNVLKSYYIKQK